MMVTVSLTALSVSRERELGTFDQLLVSPLLPSEILFGKIIPPLILGICEGSIIIFAAILFFKIPFTGSFITLYVGMFIYLMSVIGVGMFISSLCQTQQQTIMGTFIVMTPAIMLSGYVTPIENMPEWMQPITYLDPLRYFLVIAKGSFTKAMPFNIAFQEMWPMAIIAVIVLPIASSFFRSRLQ